MKTQTLIISILIVLALFGVITYAISLNKTVDKELDKSDIVTTVESSEEMAEPENKPVEQTLSNTKYLHYTSQALSETSNNRRVLFFYASWCPTCIPADKNFIQNAHQIPENVSLVRVNYNDPETDAEEKALANKYNVTYQHTFVQIDSEGNEITKWNGGQIEELLENIK